MNHDGWAPHPQLAPDGAPAECVLASLRVCANGWDPQARLVGNVRAGDIVRALDEVRERPAGPPGVPVEARPGGEWSAEALRASRNG